MIPRFSILPAALALSLAGIGPGAERSEAPADLQFDYAQGLYRDGLRALAVPELEKFAQLHPADPRTSLVQFYLGECRYADKDYKGALPAYEAAARDPKLPQRPIALYRAADCRFRTGDTPGAVEPFRQFLASKPEAGEARPLVVHAKYLLARALFAQRNFADALPLFQEVLTDPAPDNVYKQHVLLPIGDCYAALGKPDEALTRYRETEKHLVAALKEAKDPDRKAESETLHTLRAKIASILLGQKKFEEGLATLNQVEATGPLAEEILYGRAQTLLFLRRCPEALVPTLEYLKRFPEGKLAASALYIAGECCYRTDRLPEAERYLSQFLDRDKEGKHPSREVAAYARVAAAYRQGKGHAKETAADADFFLQGFASSPRAGDVQYFRAEAGFWMGDYAAALDHYRKVPPGNPYAEDATRQIAVSLDLLKRRDEAATVYDAYLAGYPNGKYHRDALERSARLWDELNQYAKAADRYGAFAAKYAALAPQVVEEFLYRKGACEYEAKQYDAMYQTFKTYLGQYPKGAHGGDVHYFLAWYHGELKHQYEAAALLYELCANMPGSYAPRARYILAHTYKRLGDARLAAKSATEADGFYGKAAECFLQLIRTAPKELAGPAEYLWAAEVFRRLLRKADAIETYEALIKTYLAEAKAAVIYQLGELALTSPTPDHARAERYFRLFLEKFPTNEFVLWAEFNLAETLKGAKKGTQGHGEAWTLYQKVEKLAAQKIENPTTRDGLILRCKLQIGRMAYDDKNYEYARDHLLRVGYLAAGEEAAEALYKAGRATLYLKDTDAAIGVWRRLLRDYPKTDWAKQLVKEAPELGLQVSSDGKSVEQKPSAP